MVKKRHLLFGFLFVLLLSACGLSNKLLETPVTTMQVVYNRVFEGSYEAWSGAQFLAPLGWAALTLLVGFILYAVLTDGRVSFAGSVVIFVLAGVVFIGSFSSIASKRPERAENQAIHAMIEGVDQAKFDKGNTFIEVLQIPGVATPIEVKECRSRVNSHTACAPYEWSHEINHEYVCSLPDEDGNRDCHWESDTEYVPYFDHLVKYTLVVNLYQKLATPETGLVHSGVEHFPKRELSGWMVPEHYNEFWYGGRRMDVSPSQHKPPADWVRWNAEIEAGEIPLISVYHRYPNWLLVTDNVFGIATNEVPRYEAANLLPGMNEIHSDVPGGWAADFDAVQFVGGLEVAQVEYDAWQEAFYPFGGFFANDRQSAMTVTFAPKSAVLALGSIDQWADAVKANYSIEEKWPITVGGETLKRMLPKNMIQLLCVVNEDRSIDPNGCRLRTGMPRGNEQIASDYMMGRAQELQGLVFDPWKFFGNVQTQLIPSEVQYSVVELVSQEPSPMSMTLRNDPNGIRRIEMAENEYLMSDIKLSQADIDALVAKEVGVQKQAASTAIKTPWFLFFGIIAFLVVLMGAASTRR